MDKQLLQRIQSLCGRQLSYAGHRCTVVDVLERENVLVLRCEDKQRSIQPNQFGEATRRVRECHSLSLFDEHRALNPIVQGWLDASLD
jgi:hypothetical protein